MMKTSTQVILGAQIAVTAYELYKGNTVGAVLAGSSLLALYLATRETAAQAAQSALDAGLSRSGQAMAGLPYESYLQRLEQGII